MNLVNNAIKFSKNGSQVLINVRSFLKSNIIYISVKDYGIGIKPEIIDKIAKPFISYND